MLCQTCNAPGARKYAVVLAFQDGLDDGAPYADIDCYLCDECLERAGDMLLDFIPRLKREVLDEVWEPVTKPCGDSL